MVEQRARTQHLLVRERNLVKAALHCRKMLVVDAFPHSSSKQMKVCSNGSNLQGAPLQQSVHRRHSVREPDAAASYLPQLLSYLMLAYLPMAGNYEFQENQEQEWTDMASASLGSARIPCNLGTSGTDQYVASYLDCNISPWIAAS